MNQYETKFPIGSIVYYFDKYGEKWDITWGIVHGLYANLLVIQTVHLMDTRLINGVPYKDFVPAPYKQKLPKGWSYNTKLYKLSHLELPKECENLSISNPQDLLKAYNNGLYINAQDYDFSHIEAEIDKNGWRLVKRYNPYERIKPTYIGREYIECFNSYEEILKALKAHEDELIRQCNLTDYEWSLEQIDKTLSQAREYDLITDEQALQIKETLLKEDIKNIETRLYEGYVQWKLHKNKKWITIE